MLGITIILGIGLITIFSMLESINNNIKKANKSIEKMLTLIDEINYNK